MKTFHIIALLLLAGTITAQTNADEILASNDLNAGKNQQTMLISQFQTMDELALDGTYKLLADNGNLKEVRSFKEGKLDGTWLQYDENKNLIAIANYKDDKKHGKWIVWDSNGIKRYELNYNNGDRTGTWKSWNESGDLLSTKEY